jgi:hypothetical protein
LEQVNDLLEDNEIVTQPRHPIFFFSRARPK